MSAEATPIKKTPTLHSQLRHEKQATVYKISKLTDKLFKETNSKKVRKLITKIDILNEVLRTLSNTSPE